MWACMVAAWPCRDAWILHRWLSGLQRFVSVVAVAEQGLPRKQQCGVLVMCTLLCGEPCLICTGYQAPAHHDGGGGQEAEEPDSAQQAGLCDHKAGAQEEDSGRAGVAAVSILPHLKRLCMASEDGFQMHMPGAEVDMHAYACWRQQRALLVKACCVAQHQCIDMCRFRVLLQHKQHADTPGEGYSYHGIGVSLRESCMPEVVLKGP